MKDMLSEEPCTMCIEAYEAGMIDREGIQRLPKGAACPINFDHEKECWDCQAARTVMKLQIVDWDMARTAVSNDRREQYRLPGAPLNLPGAGLMKMNAEGDLEDQWRWMKEVLEPDYLGYAGEDLDSDVAGNGPWYYSD